MAVAAETWIVEREISESPPQLAIAVPEMAEDEWSRLQAQRLIRSIGSVAASGEIDRENGYRDLQDAIRNAASGDEVAQRMVESNVMADLIERVFKSGHIRRVELAVNESGKLLQHGQLLEDVLTNTLAYNTVHPAMRVRVEAETRNGMRLENLHRQGLLKDYWFIVFSPFPDNMPDAEASEIGFFLGTRSCSIQGVSDENGGLIQETAFVAAVAELGAAPKDHETLAAIGAELGVSLVSRTAAETIDTPLLIHKSLIPNGLIDIVALWDKMAGGTFFGEAKPAKPYLEYTKFCQEREEGMGTRAERIVNQLLSEAGNLVTAVSAAERLEALSQKEMVDQALVDQSINPLVFGRRAADYINYGRLWLERGDMDQFIAARNNAQATAVSSSCPTGVMSELDGNGNNLNGSNLLSSKEEKMTCPFCGDKNQRGDPCSPNQSCKACGAAVRNGQIVSRGNGDGRKREREHPKSRATWRGNKTKTNTKVRA